MHIRYTVVTTEKADNRLMEIWMKAPAGERAEIAQASNEVDRDLRFDADQKGIAVPAGNNPNRRFWDRYPLRAFFEVSEPDRMVRILDFAKLPPPP